MPKAYTKPARIVPIVGPTTLLPRTQITYESTLATKEMRTRALYGTWCMKSGVVNVVTAAATDMQMPIRPVMPLNIEFAAEIVTIVGSAI